MRTAQWDTGFFDPSPEMAFPDVCDCDLIFRKSENSYTPSIFCNKDLPEILSCVAREMHSLSREDPLPLQQRRTSDRELSCPLHHWYRSVLEDIYLDVFPKEPTGTDCRFEPAGFCMSAHCFYDLPSSGYQYVSLLLPPLWQAQIHPSLSVSSDCFVPVRSQTDTRSVRKFCAFRYAKSSGCWYARLYNAGHEKRILLRSASPEDSYRILSGT